MLDYHEKYRVLFWVVLLSSFPVHIADPVHLLQTSGLKARQACVGGPAGTKTWSASPAGPKCYKYFVPNGDTGVDYNTAVSFCALRAKGATLAVIENQEEEDLAESFIPAGGSLFVTWIGLRKNASQQWHWVDGSPLNYVNWNGNPENKPLKDCAAINTKRNTICWKKQRCKTPGNVICQVKVKDACELGTDDCAVDATCDATGDGYKCTCLDGFSGDGTSCTDIDECLLHTDNCAPTATCHNTIGSFTCTCLPGFSGNGTTCADVDECKTETYLCALNAICTNSYGSFECSCLPGYSGNGIVCNDIDECTLGLNSCSEEAKCINSYGSYTCTCVAGFTGDGIKCSDVDECNLDQDLCSKYAKCKNTYGSYECNCSAGFTGNGITCYDVDECVLKKDDCAENATCTNTVGSFTCTCLAGFTGDGTKCADVDECDLDINNCDENATCANTVGSFTCTCLAGFSGDGTACNDVNECFLQTDNCAIDATCTNTMGRFTCTCHAGFSGDGITCEKIITCPGGPPGTETWNSTSDGTKCLKFFGTNNSVNVDYVSASSLCPQLAAGATLSVILNQNEEDLAESLIPKGVVPFATWIGLSRGKTRPWRWIDGTAVTYVNWDGAGGGESRPNPRKNCAAINTKRNPKWKEQKCAALGNFICQVMVNGRGPVPDNGRSVPRKPVSPRPSPGPPRKRLPIPHKLRPPSLH